MAPDNANSFGGFYFDGNNSPGGNDFAYNALFTVSEGAVTGDLTLRQLPLSTECSTFPVSTL